MYYYLKEIFLQQLEDCRNAWIVCLPNNTKIGQNHTFYITHTIPRNHLVCGKSRSSASTGPELRPDSQKSVLKSPQEMSVVIEQPETACPVSSVERLSVSPRSNTGSPIETKVADVSR
jgi:hypothetical protein